MLRTTKVLTGLTKEKEDLKLINEKLDKFGYLFETTVMLIDSAISLIKKNFLSMSRVGLTIQNYTEDSIWKDFEKDEKLAKLTDNLNEISTKSIGFQESICLKEFNGLNEMVELRRNTIQDNSTVLYTQIQEMSQSFTKCKKTYQGSCSKFDKSLDAVTKSYSEPKQFYDIILIDKITGTMKREIQDLLDDENDLINLANDLNTKVFAYITILENSIGDMKNCITKSKNVIAKLISDANKSLCENFERISEIYSSIKDLDQLESNHKTTEASTEKKDTSNESKDIIEDLDNFLSQKEESQNLNSKYSQEKYVLHEIDNPEEKTKVNPNTQIEQIMSDLFNNLVFWNSDKEKQKEEWEILRRKDSMKIISDLKNGEHAPKKNLLNLSDFIDEMTQYCLNFVAIKRNHLKNTDHEIVEYYRYTQTFIDSYDHIKRDQKADKDEAQYYQALIKNFSVKMTFIVKNFQTTFDIYHKTMKKNKNLSDHVLHGRKMISEFWNEIVDLENVVRKQRAELLEMSVLIKSTPDEFSEGDKDIEENLFKEKILIQEKSLHQLVQLTLSRFIDFQNRITPFIKVFLQEHEKLFKDLLEHGLILESLLCVVEQAEQEMMDTLTKDQNIKNLLEKEMVINMTNQIIFEPTSNISRGSQIVYHLSEEWKQVFNKYLKNRDMNALAAAQKQGDFNKENMLKIIGFTKNEYFETRKYDCRFTKSKIPYSGEVILLKDSMCILASNSIIGNDFTLFQIPYPQISELVSKNSMFGINKELIIKTNVGDIELYMGDKKSRADLMEAYQEKLRVQLASIDSLVARRFKITHKIYNPKTGILIDWDDIRDELKAVQKRYSKLTQLVNIQDFIDSGKELVFNKICQVDFVNLIFSNKPVIFDGEPYPSFLFRFKKMHECKDIDQNELAVFPNYFDTSIKNDLELTKIQLLSFGSTDTKCEFTLRDNKLTEEINYFWLKNDMVAIVFKLGWRNKDPFAQRLMIIEQLEKSVETSDEIGIRLSIYSGLFDEQNEFTVLYSKYLLEDIYLFYEEFQKLQIDEPSRITKFV